MFKVEDKKGFTLVELLAVIVILGVIMIIATPSVLDAMQSARVKSLEEYAQKVKTNGEKTYFVKKEFEGLKSPGSADIQLYVYDVKKDLELVNTGNYKGIFFMLKFDRSIFEKSGMSIEESDDVKPNTPYYGVILEDDSNILVDFDLGIEGVKENIIISMEDIRREYEEVKEEMPDSLYNVFDLYLNGLAGKEEFFGFFNEMFSMFEEQLSEKGMTREEVEAQIPDDEAIKFMLVDGDTNNEFFSTKLLSLNLLPSSVIEPENNSAEMPK